VSLGEGKLMFRYLSLGRRKKTQAIMKFHDHSHGNDDANGDCNSLGISSHFPRTLWPRKAEKRGLLAENSSWQLGKNSDAAKRFPGITLHETEFNFVMKLVGSAR